MKDCEERNRNSESCLQLTEHASIMTDEQTKGKVAGCGVQTKDRVWTYFRKKQKAQGWSLRGAPKKTDDWGSSSKWFLRKMVSVGVP